MSRKTRKLIWPLPRMATFAIVAALTILVALPVGIILAQSDEFPAPTNVEAVKDGTDSMTEIDVSWDAPTAPDDYRVSGYRVDVSEDGIAWTMGVADQPSGLTWPDTGLTAGSTRYYRVFAEYTNETDSNVVVWSWASGSAKGTTDGESPAGKPNPPQNLRTEAGTPEQTTVSLLWTAPTPVPDVTVANYRVEYMEGGVSSWEHAATFGDDASQDTVDGSGIGFAHKGRTPNTTYRYRVFAINSDDESSLSSNIAERKTAQAEKPVMSDGLLARSGGPSTIELLWYGPADPAGAPVTGYRVEISDSGTSGWLVLELDTGSRDTVYTHESSTQFPLSLGDTRYYQVYAANSRGFDSATPSTVASATTEADSTTQRPAPPRSVQATVDTTDDNTRRTTINVGWMPPAAGHAAIKSYEIEFTEDSGANWSDVVALTGATLTSAVESGTEEATVYQYQHMGREAGSSLQYRVRAHISATLFSEWTPSNIVSTNPGAAPDAPTRLTATPFNDSQINLSWVKPANPAGAPVTGYRIDVSMTGEDASWNPLVADTSNTDTTYSDTGLSAETTRYYLVFALNNSPAPGRSEASNMANATTLAAGEGGTTTPPGEQLGKAASISEGSFNSGGSVQIDWTAAPNADGYVIYAVNVAQVNNPNGEVITAPVNEGTRDTFNLGGLTVGQTYDVYVVATASGQDAQWPDAAVRVTAAQ